MTDRASPTGEFESSPDLGALMVEAPAELSFGLNSPELFAFMSGEPAAHPRSQALSVGREVLRKHVRRIASEGCLKVSEERAVALIYAVGVGTNLTMLSQSEAEHEFQLSVLTRELVIFGNSGEVEVARDLRERGAAAVLEVSLDETSVLTRGNVFSSESS